jgi:DNA repair exonuclease SbcCD ATPase subunit
MKITYLKLENFINIKAGMKKTKIEIDFSKCKNKLVLLCGPNGTGKTSLLSEMHPFANSGNMDVRGETNLIIEGKDGYKEIHIENKGDLFIIKHHYLFSKKTKSVKSFISKNNVELNPNGNVKSFKEVVYDQLGIDHELLKLMRLGSNVTSLINMKSTNRKNFATKMFSDIEVYNGFYKKVSEEYRNIKAVMKNTADKISKYNIQDVEEFDKQIMLSQQEVDYYIIEKENLQKDIVTLENKIKDIRIDDEDIVNETFKNLQHEINMSNELVSLVSDISLSKEEYELMCEKNNQQLELNLLTYKSNIDKAISERDIYYNQRQELEESIKRAASIERINNLKNAIIEYKNNIEKLEDELSNRNNYNKTMLLLLKDHCQKTIDYIRDLNIYTESDIKRLMESIINNDKIMERLETQNLSNKENYDILNAEIINIENMNIDFDIDIKDNACVKDCPYKQFYLQTIGKKNNLNKYIEERNKLNKEITRYEELYNLYNNLIFIKNHIMSYDNTCAIPIEYDFITCFENYITGKPIINTTLLNLSIDDSEKFELCNKYKNDLQSFEKEYDIIKASGLDIIELENKILDINDKILEKDNIISSNTELKIELEDTIKENKIQNDNILKGLLAKENINKLNIKFEEVKMRINEISTLKLEKQQSLDKIETYKNELVRVNDFVNKLTSKVNQLTFNKETYIKLIDEYNALKLLFEDVDVIRDSLNSSKGIPLIFLQVYLKNCPIMMNSLLNTIYDGELQIEGFLIDENEFRIPFNKSGIRVPDIVMASQGESSFISIVLSLSLIIQSMTKYDIICLDELDGPLDTKNREQFIKVLYSFISQVNSEQVFLISHNNMFDNEPIDLILTGDIDVENYKFANIVFKP